MRQILVLLVAAFVCHAQGQRFNPENKRKKFAAPSGYGK